MFWLLLLLLFLFIYILHCNSWNAVDILDAFYLMKIFVVVIGRNKILLIDDPLCLFGMLLKGWIVKILKAVTMGTKHQKLTYQRFKN